MVDVKVICITLYLFILFAEEYHLQLFSTYEIIVIGHVRNKYFVYVFLNVNEKDNLF